MKTKAAISPPVMRPAATSMAPSQMTMTMAPNINAISTTVMIARSRILRFDEGESGRCLIRLDAALVPVRTRAKRAHQGWRYLTGEDAPLDLDGAEDELAALPPKLVSALTALALV